MTLASIENHNGNLATGMEILQFKGMSRVLEHVHRWVEGKFYGIAQQLFDSETVPDAASAKAKLIQVRNQNILKSLSLQVRPGFVKHFG